MFPCFIPPPPSHLYFLPSHSTRDWCRPQPPILLKNTIESDNKVKAVWIIVKKDTGKYSTEEVTPSIKINGNVIKNPKLVADSFNTYFLTIVERMNNDTTTLTIEDATKYLAEAITKNFLNINLMPTTAN
jgi:hypothetical protein